jgi:hypothetical protein
MQVKCLYMAKTTKQPLSRSLRVYQKAAIFFVIASLLLLLAVLYLSVSQATVHITPVSGLVTTTVGVEVDKNPTSLGQVSGYVRQADVSKSKVFTLPEEGAVPVEEKAGGIVTLINESGTDQALIATTRVLSEEGVLFRLEEAVTVPANGQVDAFVRADEVGRSGEIGPTQFTIPGLNATRQTEVYAVSVDPMTGGVQYIRVVNQEDLDSAAEELKTELIAEAETVLAEGIDRDAYTGLSYETTVIEQVSDTEPGTEAGQFTLSLSLRVVATFYDEQAIADYAESELYSQLQSGYEVFEVNEEGLQISVQSANVEEESATLEVYLDGTAVISTSADILDRSRLTGKSPEEVEALIGSSEAVEEVSISFTPFWLKRMPTLEDHIKINIRKPKN